MDDVEALKLSQAMEEHSRIEELCRENRSNFIDSTFSATNSSIGDLRRKEGDAIPTNVDEFEWKRPQEIKENNEQWSVFNDPQSSDIEQGGLGDCWLLSAMALIAERPDILMDIFITKEFSSIGLYQLRICLDGQWSIVTVDDYFPCRKGYGRLAFANGMKQQLWVPLIEKAIAKLLGNYGRLVSGHVYEGLIMLTGAPCKHLSLSSSVLEKDLLWATLLSSRDQRFIMGCSCGVKKSEEENDLYKAKGLRSMHAYSILDVVQIEAHRLLRIRNPWGKASNWKDWNGDWSDDWSGWDPALKADLLNEEYRSQTGAFWISFEDFLLYFSDIDMALIRSHSWQEYRYPIQIGKAADKMVWFLIEETTQICFSLFKNGARREDKIDLLFYVHRMNADGTLGDIIIQSEGKCANFVNSEGDDVILSHGEYVLIYHNFSNISTTPVTGTVAIHSSKSICSEVINTLPSFPTDSLIKAAIKYGKQSIMKNDITMWYLTKNFAGMLLVADNRNKEKYLHLRTNCSASKNVISSRGALEVADVIPPKSRQIIIVLSHFESSNSYSTHYHANTHLTKSKVLKEGASHLPEITSEAMSKLHITSPL